MLGTRRTNERANEEQARRAARIAEEQRRAAARNIQATEAMLRAARAR